jgi:hypothetical protein
MPRPAKILASAVLEGESAKEWLRRHAANVPSMPDEFLQQYITTALWASTLPPYGACPACGNTAVLYMWDEDDEPVCGNCSERQPNHEPPADENYGSRDLAPETLKKMETDCRNFWRENWKDIQDDPGLAGHDFFLTRCHHGAGFWDGNWEREVGKRLTDAAHGYGEVNLYVGDDGLIYT